MLIAITLRNAQWKTLLPWGTKTKTLSSILQHDGTLYFVTLLVMNTLHLTFSLTSIFSAIAGGGGTSNIPLFTEPLTSMIVGRFLLHLQEWEAHNLRVNSDHPLHFSEGSTPSFVNRAMGSVAHRAQDYLREDEDVVR
ncbi:hypothetical protein C8Q74DRAFT_576772 [Fomes fomentarius]|nr:hypothetical protein C8Q74DRAFT_576772 [Fomes fomentarius]